MVTATETKPCRGFMINVLGASQSSICLKVGLKKYENHIPPRDLSVIY